jgi:hypothetical protein
MGSVAKICFVQMIGPTVDIVATAADDPSPTEKTFTPGSSIRETVTFGRPAADALCLSMVSFATKSRPGASWI